MSILFLIFITMSLESVTPNHKTALNKYAQGMGYSNKDKEYLENAGAIVADAVKKVDSEKTSEDQEKEPIFDPESFEEFDFISKKGEGLFFPKNVKLSHAGAAFITYLSTAQTTDRTVLERRSQILVYLEKNPEFKAELIKIMRSLKPEAEESFLEIAWPLTEKEKEEQNDLFFNRSNLIWPDFITKRLISQRFVNWYAAFFSNHPSIFNFLNIIHKPVLYSLASSIVVFLIRFVLRGDISSGRYVDPEGKKLTNLSNAEILFKGASEYKKWIWPQVSQAGVSFERRAPLSQRVLTFVSAEIVLWVLPFYLLFKATKDYYKSFVKSERSLISAQKTVQVCRRLDQLLSKHPEFSKHLLLKDTLQITKKTQVSDGNSRFVLNQLNNNRMESPSFLNYLFLGTRIAVNKILVDHPEIMRNSIFPVLAGLGEIDAYCALSAQLSNYSVPQFVDNGIQISLKQFFHPNIKNPVCNDLDLSQTGKKKICVSGGNGSGKSAITRSVVGAMVAAQTFNRVSALSATVSCFDRITVFANLKDNLDVESKFQAELRKLKKLREYLEKNPEKKVLLMLDEPLTSTNTELVGKILRDLFGLFDKYQNLVIFCVSNTPGLKDLEGALHMGTIVDTNSDGTFKPTYLWKEGSAYVSDVWYQFRKIFGPEFGTPVQVVRN